MNIIYNFIFLNLILLILQNKLIAQSPVFEHKISKDVKYLDADELTPFYEGYAVLRKGNAEMMIDKNGNTVFPYFKYIFPYFDHPYWMRNTLKTWHQGFNDRKCFVVDHGTEKLYLIDENEMELVPHIPESIPRILDNGFIHYPSNIGDRYFNFTGAEILVPEDKINSKLKLPKSLQKYTVRLADIKSQRLWIYDKSNGKTGLADFNGNIILQPIFTQRQEFSEDLAPVMKPDEFGKEKWGYIDLNGKIAIDFKFSNRPSEFHDGLAIVVPAEHEQGFLFGYIDKNENLKIKIPYSDYKMDNYKYGSFPLGLFFNAGVLNHVYPDPDKYTRSLIYQDGKTYSLIKVAEGLLTQLGLKRKFISQYGHTYSYYIRFDPTYKNGVVFYNAYGDDTSISNKAGMLILEKNINIPPRFETLRDYDKISGLTFAEAYINKKLVKGYINEQAEFVFILKEKSKW